MAEYVNPRAQACQNCVKAKAKCYGHSNGRCERCGRLNRDCLMPELIIRTRKSRRTIQQAQADRIAQLEERLNSLTSTLNVSRPLSLDDNVESSAIVPEAINISSNSSSAASHELFESRPILSYASNVCTPNHQTALPTLQPSQYGEDNYEATPPAPQSPSPDELLNFFRQNLARQVPFVYVPAHLDARSLSEQKPFLYQAIIFAASYHDSVHQLALGQEFTKDVTEHLVMRGEKSLDILQGLLVYISWYAGLFGFKTQLNVLIGLIFSLVIDLHLSYPMPGFENHEKFLGEMKGIVSNHQSTWARRTEPTKEEKRTILGCFYIFSAAATVSLHFCRVNPLHWTPFLQQCHDDLLASPETENDIYLAHLSYLQRISEDVQHSGIHQLPPQPNTWNVAFTVHFKLLLSELRKFKDSLPESIAQDDFMILNYYTVEMRLLEICFFMPPTNPTSSSSLQRVDVLSMCLTATQAFLRHYFSLENKPYVNFARIITSQIYFAMMVLSKFSFFHAEDWNMRDVEMEMDLSTVVDRVSGAMEEASAKFDRLPDKKPWLQLSQKVRQIRVQFDLMLAAEDRSLSSLSDMQRNGTLPGAPFSFNQFDLLDDFWQNMSENTYGVN
ncbi:hypothetical protein L207DRAFT_416925 [Hyaloscypha variabilis F]|uniref:Zn(2)-C6 fungal-type domain-containing protein n=1 Tax=Hyaloscypha variabilis (strain UAMH 11265 / GT02V1 / F) TaxID=1149755 RepID=A0A2J6SAN6_HYAVF|nr:hypothetical protein L207DRAFT_416925 [Hyaloscypha variabilis F]